MPAHEGGQVVEVAGTVGLCALSSELQLSLVHQVDYFGVAATLYTILNCSYMDIVKDNETDHYKVSSALPR